MIEEVRMSDCGDGEENSGGDEDRVSEWVNGLPGEDDLTPLSQSLVPPILALAFMITPERSRTIQDVNRAAQNTISSSGSNGSSGVANASSSNTAVAVEEMDLVESSSPGSDPKKFDGGEGEDSVAEEGDSESEDPCGKTLKRPRLVWTPKLHKRFVDVVTHLGVRNAVPKTIMQMMNVNGLTRENVASHLQKYRLYLKRIQGSTTGDLSSSDQLFSVPPHSFQNGGIGDAGTGNMRIPAPAVMPMQGYYNNGHYQQHRQHGNGVFESNPYMMQQNKFGFKSTSSSLGGGGVNDK